MQCFQKKLGDEVDFLVFDKGESFYKLAVLLLLCILRHAQSTQNNKFAISLQYLKKEVSDKVDFLHVDKHQSFLQVNFNTLGI